MTVYDLDVHVFPSTSGHFYRDLVDHVGLLKELSRSQCVLKTFPNEILRLFAL